MSVFVEAARLLGNLGALGSQFVGVDSPDYRGEYIGSSVTSMSADFLATPVSGIRLRESWHFMKKPGVKPGQSFILWTLTAVELLELTTGFGPPCEGDQLIVGSDEFAALRQQLASGPPGDHWQGSAAQAYADWDTVLQDVVQTLADLDLQLAALAKDQAEWVTHTRLGLGILKDILFACAVVEWTMRVFSPLHAEGFAIKVSIAGFAIALGMLGTLAGFSTKSAQAADDVARQYPEATARATPSGVLLAATAAPAAEGSMVSGFDVIPAGMPGQIPGGQAAPGALVRQDHMGVPSETSDDALPATQMLTMPTVSQLAGFAGQTETLSGHTPRYGNAIEQKLEHVQ